MFGLLLLFFKKFDAVLKDFADLMVLIREFFTLKAQLDKEIAKQTVDTKGVAIGKLVDLDKLIKLIVKAARKARTWAEEQGNEQLEQLFDVQESDFKIKAHTVVLKKMEPIRDAIFANIKALAGKRVFPETVEAIDLAIAAANASMNAPADANAEKVVATAIIVELVDKLKAILANIDDLLISEYDDTTDANNAMVKEYIHDQNLVDLPTRHTGVQALIKDEGTKAAVSGVEMSIPALKKVGISDLEGMAEIIRMKPGTNSLVLKHPDYETVELLVHVESGRVLEIEVVMKRK